MSIGMLIMRLIPLSIPMSPMLLLWLMTWPTCLLPYGGALLERLVVFLQLHIHSRSGARAFRRPVTKFDEFAVVIVVGAVF